MQTPKLFVAKKGVCVCEGGRGANKGKGSMFLQICADVFNEH